MSLRSVLRALNQRTQPLHFEVPQPRQLATAVDQIVKKYGDDGTVKASPKDLEALLWRIRRNEFDWPSLSPRDQRDVVWVLWAHPALPAEHPRFLDGFLNWIARPFSRTQASRLSASWAEALDPERPSIRTVAAWLDARADLLAEPWRSLGRHFRLFSVDEAPALLADAFLESGEEVDDFFERLRLRGRAAAGGLGLEMLLSASAKAEANMNRSEHMASRVIALSMHQETFRPKGMLGTSPARARQALIGHAEALLLPWSQRDPPENTKAIIIEHLLRHYRDARLHTAVWEDMRPPSRDTMRRWLSAETINAFFRLMSEMHIENPGHWRRRRKFWMAYLDHIDHAWLVAGAQAADLARKDELAFGRLSGARSDHCVLMLVIKGMTIVDWNHAGSVRMWSPGDPKAPTLYGGTDGSRYLRTDLVAPTDLEFRHTGNDAGRWQDAVHNEIRKRTGIRLQRSEYF